LNTVGAVANGFEMLEKTGKSNIPTSLISGGKMNIQVPARSFAIYVSEDEDSSCSMDSVIYVDQNATGLKNGSDWNNALTNLASALSVQKGCTNVHEIRIKEGTYYPNVVSDRTLGFQIPANVTMIGGFQSSGNPVLGDQDIDAYPTILSGDIGIPANYSDNVHNVVKVENGLDSAYLEALIIENGNADGIISEHQNGGGIHNTAPLVLKDVIVRNNEAQNGGNGIYNLNNTAILTMDNVNLLNNTGSISDVKNENNATIIVRENSEIRE